MEDGDRLSVRRLRQGAATGGFKRKQSGGKVPTLYKKNRTDVASRRGSTEVPGA